MGSRSQHQGQDDRITEQGKRRQHHALEDVAALHRGLALKLLPHDFVGLRKLVAAR